MFYLVSHVVYQNAVPIFGPIHVVSEYLRQQGLSSIQITAPLTDEGVYSYITDDFTLKIAAKKRSTALKYIHDVIFFAKMTFKKLPVKADTVIAADPLSALFFSFLKPFLQFRLIYYTVDFADTRFSNKVLDLIYRSLDLFSLRAADQNWCVSERIVQIRRQQGYAKKAVFVPNTNLFAEPPRAQRKHHQKKLVYVGRMEENMYLPQILAACKAARTFKLMLIGGGSLDKSIVRYIKQHRLQRMIFYLGPQPNAVVQRQLRSQGIGLALYGTSYSWNTYGDSMKIREYQQYGLPVITSNVPSNADEIRAGKAGIVLENKISPATILDALVTVQQNYAMYTQNTRKIALKYIKSEVLHRLLLS